MAINVTCPSCGRTGRGPEQAIGRMVRCPACEHRYKVTEELVPPAARSRARWPGAGAASRIASRPNRYLLAWRTGHSTAARRVPTPASAAPRARALNLARALPGSPTFGPRPDRGRSRRRGAVGSLRCRGLCVPTIPRLWHRTGHPPDSSHVNPTHADYRRVEHTRSPSRATRLRHVSRTKDQHAEQFQSR